MTLIFFIVRVQVFDLGPTLTKREKERVHLLQEITDARNDKKDLRIRLAYANQFQTEWSKGIKRLGGLGGFWITTAGLSQLWKRAGGWRFKKRLLLDQNNV